MSRMVAYCADPIWRDGDFSSCFKRDYLLTLLPLIACGLSFLHISTFTLREAVASYKRTGYLLLRKKANGANGIDTLGAEEELEDDDEDAQLTLVSTIINDPSAEISRSPGATIVIFIEALCLLGEVGISLAVISTEAWGEANRTAAVATLVIWVYISAIAFLRLYSHLAKEEFAARLWNHTAYLYSILFVFSAILFRSAIIHPISAKSQALMAARFALSFVLVIISLTTRVGNRDVLLIHEDGIDPSREPVASLVSIATFMWVDGMILRGWRKPLQIGDVWNVLPKEKAGVILASFRRYRKTTGLAVHLIKYFSQDLLFQQFWAFISGIFLFAPTLLLKAILEYVEHPDDTPVSTAWLWVILLLICAGTTGVADGQALWRGRKITLQLRTVMIGEIYAKTLRRKAASSGDTDMNAPEKKSKDENDKKSSIFKQLYAKFFKKKEAQEEASLNEEDDPADKASDTQVNSGTIINLMSVDSFRVSEISAYWHFLIPSVPVQLAVAITLLFRILGWSALAGIGIMIAVLPLNIFFSRSFSAAHKRIMAATDARIHTTNEVLQNVRIIKFFAWEDRFANNINEKRRVELAAVRYRFMLWAGASLVWYAVPMTITAFSFFLYTVVEKKSLVPSVAFTAISLFGLLRYPLDRLADMLAHVLESRVSVKRVEKFLDEDETSKYEQLKPSSDLGSDNLIGFKNATFSWGPIDEPSGLENPAFRMINMDIEFKVGGLNIIAGPTGSGKTSLLMALLGEMTLLRGHVHLPGGYDRALLKPRENGLIESVAYCAQQAWLVNDTIKQNILFASPYDENRYQSVIEACALRKDFEVFDAGDSTLVGEKGIVVSGGQKQRISLARALYSNARHLLLDDCLSAVDSHTAQHIFEHCIVGPIMDNRTCILVTHNIALTVPQSDHVVVLRNGKIAGQGPPEKVMASGILGEDLPSSQSASKIGTRDHSRAQSSVDLKTNGSSLNGAANGHTDSTEEQIGTKKKQTDIIDANARTEDKAEGAVDWRVIALYLRSMGPWYLWASILFAFAGENVVGVATNVWIRQWANSYSTEAVGSLSKADSPRTIPLLEAWKILIRPFYIIAPSQGHLDVAMISGAVDIGYYLGIYVLLAALYILVAFIRLMIQFTGSLNASRKLHVSLLNSVLRAKFKFFDTTPLGQIINRFSKDLQSIDQDVAPVAAGVLQTLFSIVTIVLLISVITPGFLIAGVLLTALYVAIGALYIQSSRDLKRLESTHRSPLYQQFGETLSGVTTIRAYGDERRFLSDNARRINTYNRPFIYLWAANRWLALRVDFAGALVSFFAATFIVLNAKTLDAGAAGLSLTYALVFNENVLWLVRLYAENEQNMNHVERVKTFLDVEQEAPAQIPATKTPGSWPSKGAVRFVDYSTSYRADLDPVLKHLSFDIKAEEKIGIVGRTGAGKSSLALALFRGLEADSGKIYIDDIDIGNIGLQDLRENLTIVPQDPTLFTGTIRSNLDPFGLFTDEEIFTALRRVRLIGLKGVSTSTAPSQTLLPSDESSGEVPGTAPLAQLETDHSAFEEAEASATTDLSAPAPLRRGSMSIPPVGANEATADLTRVMTNTRENTNVFLNLASPIAESGTNLSQGQRQLLCLARALLKAPRVLIMDEATASIDYATDAKIQDTLRELNGSTIITIAHRLQTIIDYDKVLVLEKGQVVELGSPWELIGKEAGIFRSMCEMSGDFEVLVDSAKRAERKANLVDIDE